MEVITEQRLLEQHVIVASLMYIGYQVLWVQLFLGGFSLFELNGLLIYFVYFPVFMAINFNSYLLVQKRFLEWPLALHVGLLFLMINMVLGRIR